MQLRQPAEPPEPEPRSNPLGEWYADYALCKKFPMVAMRNAATGALLVLPGQAEALPHLHHLAMMAFTGGCIHHGIEGAAREAEIRSFADGFAFAAANDRDALDMLEYGRQTCWVRVEAGVGPVMTTAVALEDFSVHRFSSDDASRGSGSPIALDRLRRCLKPDAVVPFRPRPKPTPDAS